MINKKKLSIIIPVFNVEEYLPKCIESVVNQTYDNLEILLINDGSTDNSGVICDNFAHKDERVKVVHKENGGLSAARNLGLSLATGHYIAFLDSDDYWNPLFLEKMIEKMESDPSYGLVYSGYYKERKGKPAKKFGDLFIEKELLKARLENRQGWHLCAFLIRKSFIA